MSIFKYFETFDFCHLSYTYLNTKMAYLAKIKNRRPQLSPLVFPLMRLIIICHQHLHFLLGKYLNLFPLANTHRFQTQASFCTSLRSAASDKQTVGFPPSKFRHCPFERTSFNHIHLQSVL